MAEPTARPDSLTWTRTEPDSDTARVLDHLDTMHTRARGLAATAGRPSTRAEALTLADVLGIAAASIRCGSEPADVARNLRSDASYVTPTTAGAYLTTAATIEEARP